MFGNTSVRIILEFVSFVSIQIWVKIHINELGCGNKVNTPLSYDCVNIPEFKISVTVIYLRRNEAVINTSENISFCKGKVITSCGLISSNL